MQYSKEEKQQHLDNWRNSGLSQSAYCRQNSLKLATFHYWKIQADKAVKSTVTPFIPTTVKASSGIISVNTPGGVIYFLPTAPVAPSSSGTPDMLIPEHVWIARQPVDMRCGVDKLTQYVSEHPGQTWQSEAAFIFCNKARTRIKLLRWDKHGVWLAVRRLHCGHFVWPRGR